MTSFVQKQERLFREAGDGDLVPLRSVGRIKDYDSCTDRRAWVANDEPRRQYILEMIKASSKKSSSFGKYIPIEVLIDILLQQKISENEKLKKRIKELEALLELYNSLELTDDQKRKVHEMKEALGVSGDDLESAATSSFFSDYDTDIDDVMGGEGGLPGTARSTDKGKTIGGESSRDAKVKTIGGEYSRDTEKVKTTGGEYSRDTDKVKIIGGEYSRDTDKVKTIGGEYSRDTDKEGTFGVKTAREIEKESMVAGARSPRAKGESPETKVVFSKIPGVSGESSRVSFDSPGTSPNVSGSPRKTPGTSTRTPGGLTRDSESPTSESPCPYKRPCEPCKTVPCRDDRKTQISPETSGSPRKTPGSLTRPSESPTSESPCPYKQPCQTCRTFISPSRVDNESQTSPRMSGSPIKVPGSPVTILKSPVAIPKSPVAIPERPVAICPIIRTCKPCASAVSTNYSTSSEDFTTLTKEPEIPKMPRTDESPRAILVPSSQPGICYESTTTQTSPRTTSESALNQLCPHCLRAVSPTGSPHSFKILCKRCARSISPSRVSESPTNIAAETHKTTGCGTSDSHVAESNMQINELQNMLIKKDEEIAMLQDNLLKLSSLITDNEELTQLLIQTQLALDSAQNEKAQLAKNVASTKPQDISSLEAEIETIRDKGNLTPDQETDVIKKELDVLKKYCDNLSNIQEENEELKSECIRLQQELQEALNGDDEEKAALHKKCADYAEQIKILQNKLQSAVADVLESDEIKDLQRRSDLLNDVLNEREELRKQLKEIEDLKNQSSQNVDFLEQENKDLIDELNQLKQYRKQEAGMCASEIAKCKIQIQDQANELCSLKCEKNKLNNVLETIQRERDELHKQLAFMERQFKEQDDEMDELRIKVREAELLKLERDRLHLRLEELLTLEVEVITLVEQIKNLSIERDTYKKQICELDCIITDQEDEIKQLLYHIDRLSQNVDKQKEKLSTVIKDYQNELDERNCMLESVENQLGKLTKEIEDYQNELNEKNCMLCCGEQERESLRKVIDDFENELNQKNNMLANVEKQREKLKEVIEDYQSELDEKNCMLSCVEKQREKLREVMEDFQKELDVKNCMLACSTDELAQLKCIEKAIKQREAELMQRENELLNTIHEIQKTLDDKEDLLNAMTYKCSLKVSSDLLEAQQKENERLKELICELQQCSCCNHIDIMLEESKDAVDVVISEVRSLYSGKKTPDSCKYYDYLCDENDQLRKNSMEMQNLARERIDELTQQLRNSIDENAELRTENDILQSMNQGIETALNMLNSQLEENVSSSVDDECTCETEYVNLRKKREETAQALEDCLCIIVDSKNKLPKIHKTEEKTATELMQARSLKDENTEEETATELMQARSLKDENDELKNQIRECLYENSNLKNEVMELRKKYDNIIEEQIQAQMQKDSIHDQIEEKIGICTNNEELKKLLDECLCENADLKFECFNTRTKYEHAVDEQKRACSQIDAINHQLEEQILSSNAAHDELKKQLDECLYEKANVENKLIEMRMKYEETIKALTDAGTQSSVQKVDPSISTVESTETTSIIEPQSTLEQSTKDPSTVEPSFGSYEQKYEIESIIRKSKEEENEELKTELAETTAIVQKLSQEMEEVPQQTMELISSISHQFKEENEVLKTENVALKEVITRLEEELQKTTTILDSQGLDLQKVNQNLEEQIEALKNELQAYAEGSQHAIAGTESGLENLKILNQELGKQIEYLKSEIDRLAALITDGMSPHVLNDLKDVNKQQQEEIERLENLLKNMNISPEMLKDNEGFKEEIENLKELIRQQEKEIEDFKMRCKCLAFKLQDSQLSISSADITDERAKILINKLKNDILDLECENNCLRMCLRATNPEDEKSAFNELDVFTKNKRLEAELKDLKEELECMRTCAAFGGTVDDLEAKLKALQEKYNESEAKLRSMQDTHKALQDKHEDTLRDTHKALQEKHGETLLQDQLGSELNKLRAMVQQLQSENSSLADKHRVITSDGDDQINSLLAKLKELQAELDDTKMQMERMKADQKELLDRLEQTVKRGTAAESDLENEIKKLKSKIRDLELVIQQQQSTIDQLRGGGDDIRIKELEAKLKQTEAEKDHFENRIGLMQKEQDELTDQIDNRMQMSSYQESGLESEIIKLRSKVKELETYIKDLENQIKDCKAKLADSVDKQKVTDLENQLANMASEKNAAMKEKDNLVAEIFDLKSKIDSLLKEISTLQGDKDVLKNTLKDLDVCKNELEELRKQLDILRKQLDKVRADNNQDKALVESLRKEKDSHKKDLKDLTDKLQLGPGPDDREEKNRLNALIKMLEKQLKDCEEGGAGGNLADELKKLKAEYDQMKAKYEKEKAEMQANYDQNLALAKEQYERDLKYVRGRHSDGIVRLQTAHEDTVSDTIKNYEREIENLQNQLAELSKKLKDTEESLSAKQIEACKLRKQLRAALEEIQAKDDEIAKLKKALDNERNKSSELEKQLADALKNLEEEQNKYAAIRKELCKMRKELEKEKNKNAELSAALEAEKIRAENALKLLEDEQNKTADLQKKLCRMRKELESEKNKNAELSAALEAEKIRAENALKLLEDEQNKTADLQKKLCKMRKELENEKNRAADLAKALEDANNSSSSKDDDLSKAQKDLENEKTINAQLVKDIENLNNEIADLKNLLSDKDDEILRLLQLLADRDSEINQLKKDLEQIDKLLAELDAEKNKNAELENKLQTCKESEKGQGDANELIKQDLEDAQRKLAAGDAALAKLRQEFEDEMKRLDEALEEEKRKCAAKDDEIAHLKSIIAALEDELDRLRKELENEKKKNDDCAEALEEQRKRAAELEGHLEAAKKDLHNLKQQLFDAHKALEEETERNKQALKALHAENMEKMKMMTRPSALRHSQTDECPCVDLSVQTDGKTCVPNCAQTDKCHCAEISVQTDVKTCVPECAQTDKCPCATSFVQTDVKTCFPECAQTDVCPCAVSFVQTDIKTCVPECAQTDVCLCGALAETCPCGALIAQRKIDSATKGQLKQLSTATALMVEIKQKKLFLTRKTIVMTNLPPASDGTVTSDDYGRQIISVEEERPINLTKSIENILTKALKSGLENLTFEELKDLHTKTTNAANIINQPLEGPSNDQFNQLTDQPKVSLMRRIATLETELGTRHKAAQEKMSILDRTLQVEKQRLNEMKKALLSERKRNNDLLQKIGMQTRENANIEVERDLLKRQTSYHEDRLQKLIVTIEEEKAERRKLEEELSKGKNTERTLKTLLESEKERANNIKIKATDTVNLLRIRLEKALDSESQLKTQLGTSPSGRIQRSRGPNSITDSRSRSPTPTSPTSPGRRQSPTPRSFDTCPCRHKK